MADQDDGGVEPEAQSQQLAESRRATKPARRGVARARATAVIRHTRLMGVALLLLAAWPATAPASRLDVASARTALHAYHRYLAAVNVELHTEARAEAFATSIAATCPNVLAPLALLPDTAARHATVMAFGEEIGFDLVISMKAAVAPFARLAPILSRLRWSSPRTTRAIEAWITAMGAFNTLAPSELCSDARAISTSNAETTPPTTLQFIATVNGVVRAAGAGVSRFVHVLQRFETPSETSLRLSDNRLVTANESALQTLSEKSGKTLLSVLGL